jgi:hypothetical protein
MKTTVILSIALSMIVSFSPSQIYAPHGSSASNSPLSSSPSKNGSSEKHLNGLAGWNGTGYGNVALAWGAGPNYYQGYNYGSMMSIKKSARFSLRAAGMLINDAVNFNSWHDIYSPILAKAIRHYHYSRQLYYWRDYAGAYAHAERARYLAWHSFQYFKAPCATYMEQPFAYPDPYGDPYDPYYRKNGAASDENEMGGLPKRHPAEKMSFPKEDALDEKLPSGKSDKEMIKSFRRVDADE